MEGKVKIRGVKWEFYKRGDMFCCSTSDPVDALTGRSACGTEYPPGTYRWKNGYAGGFDEEGEAIEVAVDLSARTHPFPDEAEVWDEE